MIVISHIKHWKTGLLLSFVLLLLAAPTVAHAANFNLVATVCYPQGLALGPNGVLYGSQGATCGYTYGDIFSLTPDLQAHQYTFKTVYSSFTGLTGAPVGNLAVDSSGNVYGLTCNDCNADDATGALFELTPDGDFENLDARFGNSYQPDLGLLFNRAHSVLMYTTTDLIDYLGSSYVFVKGLDGSSIAQVDFTDNQNVLALDPQGTAYGIYAPSGTTDWGLYRMNLNSTEPWSPLYSSSSFGTVSGLVADASGNVFGVNYDGGTCGVGWIFKFSIPTKTFTTLYNFGTSGTSQCWKNASSPADGSHPWGNPVLDAAGNLYGITLGGGINKASCPLGCGTIWKLAADGALTTLHAFSDGSDGVVGFGNTSLVIGPANKVLFGTSTSGVYAVSLSQ